MDSDQSPPAPGWYEDPRGGTDLRWWNGRSWTEQTARAPGGGAFAPPVAGSEAAPAVEVAQVAEPVPAARGAAEGPSALIAGRERPLASWWARAGAFILDNVITFALLVPFLAAAIALVAGIDFSSIKLVDGKVIGLTQDEQATTGLAILLLVAGSMLVAVTYQPLTMRRTGINNGRTWGMQAFDIRVVRDNGSPMTYGSALVRQFLVMGLLFGVVQFVGNSVTVIGGTVAVLLAYLWPLWDKQNRAGQDIICSTHVVRD